jgi:hypothetical protein
MKSEAGRIAKNACSKATVKSKSPRHDCATAGPNAASAVKRQSAVVNVSLLIAKSGLRVIKFRSQPHQVTFKCSL